MPITGYFVERKSGFSSRWTKVNKSAIPELQYEFTDLSEGTDYEFRVMAANEAGVGPGVETAPFTAKDPFDKPGKPGRPVVDEITKETASISWSAPESDGGAPITNYMVEMRKAGEVKWKKVNKKDEKVSETKYTVPGLVEEMEYEFRVTAENKAGQGPPSDPSEPRKYGK